MTVVRTVRRSLEWTATSFTLARTNSYVACTCVEQRRQSIAARLSGARAACGVRVTPLPYVRARDVASALLSVSFSAVVPDAPLGGGGLCGSRADALPLRWRRCE